MLESPFSLKIGQLTRIIESPIPDSKAALVLDLAMRIAVKIPIKDCKSAGGALSAFPVARGKIAPKWGSEMRGSRRLRNDMHRTGPTVTTGRLDGIYSTKSPDFKYSAYRILGH